jgi:hypothetical protein
MRISARRAVEMALLVHLIALNSNSSQVSTKLPPEISETEYAVFSAYITEAFTGAKAEARVSSRVSRIVIGNRTINMYASHIEDENDKAGVVGKSQ